MQLDQTKWAKHLYGCAQITNNVTKILDIRDDTARQATFATVCIDATKHNIFVEPIPESNAPVIQPETAAVESNATKKGVGEAAAVKPAVDEAAAKDAQAAERADAQVQEIVPNPTPEMADGARRSALLVGIESGKTLLNKAGFTPIITPKELIRIINEDMKIPGNLGTLDTDQLGEVVKMLADKLDTFRSNMKALEADAPF
jgi:hypothetical protein